MNADLELMNNSPDLGFRGAEVDQQTNGQPRGLQIIHALGMVDVIELFCRFELDNDLVGHHQIGHEFAHYMAAIPDADRVLLSNADSRFAQFNGQRIFINLFDEATAKFIAHPVNAADYQLCHFIGF